METAAVGVLDSRQEVNGEGRPAPCGLPATSFPGSPTPPLLVTSHWPPLSAGNAGSSHLFAPHFPASGKIRPCYLGRRGERILVGHQRCLAQMLSAFILNLSCLLLNAF